MLKENDNNIIESLQKKWSAKLLLSTLLFSVGIVLLLFAVINFLFLSKFFLFLATILSLLVFAYHYEKINKDEIVKFINYSLPEAEESALLFLKPEKELKVFEKLQRDKIKAALSIHLPTPDKIKKKLKHSIIFLAFTIVVSVIIYIIPNSLETSTFTTTQNSIIKKPEVKLPEIANSLITISPPSYTKKDTRKQDKFNIVAEEGATITWNIATTIAIEALTFTLNDKSVIKAQSIGGSKTNWFVKKQVVKSGFYQVNILNKISELYSIDIIKDQPPTLSIQLPKPQTIIESGISKSIMLSANIKDDYAIQSVSIHATIASGSGEAVSFKEQQLSFPSFNAGSRQAQLKRILDLNAFGMKPGDELYFYISASDSKGQAKRTNMYSIRIADTAELMSIEGMASGVDKQPEFFRSQRQIIIETEQLLRDKPNISPEAFKIKSADLGVDQKLLRLRYGKFLGEETDIEIGEGEHHEEEHAGIENTDIQNIIDQYSHKHDISEDATFFDAKTKKQLKATLTEMWKAELQLRIIHPKEALPFEYKALKLLKELQQQTRAYVAKTGIKTTPLKTEKRLTGELDKINQPVFRSNSNADDPSVVVRKSLGLLEEIRYQKNVNLKTSQTLEDAAMQLSNSAAQNPSSYLDALTALQKILKNNFTEADINKAAKGLQKMLLPPPSLPVQIKTKSRNNLSQQYFININRRND